MTVTILSQRRSILGRPLKMHNRLACTWTWKLERDRNRDPVHAANAGQAHFLKKNKRSQPPHFIYYRRNELYKQNKTKQKLPNINYWKKTCTSLCPVGRDPAWAHGKEDAIMLCAALLMISEMFRFAISCDHHRFQHLIFILINYCGYVYYVGWRLTDTMNLTYAAFCR